MQNIEIGLRCYLYRRTNRNGIRLFKEKLLDNFDNSLPTYVILHGMGNNHNSLCQRGIRNALYQDVARKVGNILIKEKVDPSKTHFIGMSLGAEIAGVVARRSGFTPRDIYDQAEEFLISHLSLLRCGQEISFIIQFERRTT